MRLHRASRLTLLLTALVLVAAACSTSSESEDAAPTDPVATDDPPPTGPDTPAFPPAPPTPTGDLSEAVRADLDSLFLSLTDEPDVDALERLGATRDPRLGWLFMDLLLVARPGTDFSVAVADAFVAATGTAIDGGRSAWGTGTDLLIAWDTPAPPDYVQFKRIVYERIEPAWQPFFADADADIDWRWVAWGGVLIDDRPLTQTAFACPEGCIPALNDPGLVQAGTEDDWLDDDRIVFGVEVDGEAVAFPKNIMEIHEMVNMTIGDRRVGIPYCTLCGSPQAYLTDVLDDLPADDALAALEGQVSLELRTSGLLSRSNKVMYEFHTKSVFDTFTGAAVSGPLQDTGLVLEQVSVVTTTWGDWKADYPDSMLVASDGGIGRFYQDDPLRGRDDNGPIFPIGTVDGRLAVQEPVLGVILDDGTPMAFPVAAVTAAVDAGEEVNLDDVAIQPRGGGFVAVDTDGEELATHQSFWFAWSQFHPETRLWNG